MAIKVGGITVVDDSRQLTNIASVDATTVSALSNAGVGAGGGVVTLTSSGSINSKEPVILTDTGYVSSVGLSVPSNEDTQLLSPATDNISIIWHTANSVYIAGYHDAVNNAILYKVGTPSSGTITWSSPTTLPNTSGASSSNISFTYDVANNKVVVAHSNPAYNGPYIKTYTLSGNTLSLVGSVARSEQSIGIILSTYHAYSQTVVLAYAEGYSSNMQYWVTNVNSSTTTPTTSATYQSTLYGTPYQLTCNPYNQFVYVSYREASTSGYAYIDRWDVPNTVGNIAEQWPVGNYQTFPLALSFDTTTQAAVLVGRVTNSGNVVKYFIWESVGHAQYVYSSSIYPAGSNPVLLNNPVSGKIHSLRIDDLDNYSLKESILDYTSSVLSEGSETTLISSGVDALVAKANLVDNFSGRAIYGYNYGGTTTTRIARLVSEETNLTSTNLLGIASETKADGQSTKVSVIGSTVDGFTGLTIGSNYYVQEDGSITTSNSGQLIGKAISATQILITQV